MPSGRRQQIQYFAPDMAAARSRCRRCVHRWPAGWGVPRSASRTMRTGSADVVLAEHRPRSRRHRGRMTWSARRFGERSDMRSIDEPSVARPRSRTPHRLHGRLHTLPERSKGDMGRKFSSSLMKMNSGFAAASCDDRLPPSSGCDPRARLQDRPKATSSSGRLDQLGGTPSPVGRAGEASQRLLRHRQVDEFDVHVFRKHKNPGPCGDVQDIGREDLVSLRSKAS